MKVLPIDRKNLATAHGPSDPSAPDPAPSRRPGVRLEMRLALAVAAIVILAIPFAIVLLEVLYKGPLTELDSRVANSANAWGLRSAVHVRIANDVTFFGSTLWLTAVVVVALLYLAVFRRRRRDAALLLTTAVVGSVIDTVVKLLVRRARPQFSHPVAHALGKSFPSGHTMNSTIIYGALLVISLPTLHRAGKWIATIATCALVAAIAVSRVALGLHYISDVVGAILLGLAWLLASTSAFHKWRREGGHLPDAIESAPTIGPPAANADHQTV